MRRESSLPKARPDSQINNRNARDSLDQFCVERSPEPYEDRNSSIMKNVNPSQLRNNRHSTSDLLENGEIHRNTPSDQNVRNQLHENRQSWAGPKEVSFDDR